MMKAVKKLNVLLSIEGGNYEVGELVAAGSKIYFKYNAEYIKTGLNLSPFKLPFVSEVVCAEPQPFEGLFGVFSDSLPDGWGRLLLDKSLLGRGIDISQITPLHRLGFVGAKGMGALQYKPALEYRVHEIFDIELDFWNMEMRKILGGSGSEILDELRLYAGSSGGARPKILIGFNPQNGHLVPGVIDASKGYEEWLIKFPSAYDHPEVAHIEFAYHKLALLAGLEMSACRLFKGKSGKVYFGTKRFDRHEGHCLHMHTAAGLMHDNFRMSTMDYGHLMDCAFRLEKHHNAYKKVFRLAVFNVYAHNRDDHSKNFSFIMNASGEWRFAPAYDLTFSHSNFGFHSTSIAGESKNPGRKDLMKLARHFGIDDASLIIDEVQEAVNHWDLIANECGIEPSTRKNIQSVFEKIRD